MAPRERHQCQFQTIQRDLLKNMKGRKRECLSYYTPEAPQGLARGAGRGWKTDIDLEEALGYIFGCFREDFGPLKFLFFLPFPPPHETAGVGIKESK